MRLTGVPVELYRKHWLPIVNHQRAPISPYFIVVGDRTRKLIDEKVSPYDKKVNINDKDFELKIPTKSFAT
jgi:hypothetical protein